MDKVALNLPWLRASLAETAKVDEICRRLLGISERVYGPGKKDHSRDIRLHIMRNDFMLESTVGSSGFAGRQIELNMIAASFSTHCADLTEVHRYALVKYIPRLRPDCDAQDVHEALQQALPRSPNTDGIAAALAQAQRVYANRWKPTGKPRVVLFISSEKENNELDHRKLEISLFKNHKVLTVRRSLAALSAQCSTLLAPLEPAGFDGAAAADGSRGPQALLVDGHEVAVAYFREGYWPGQFCPAEECWTARETIEISEAVKCPSAPAQLAGMKKVQQLLSQAHELRRFAPDGVGQRLRRCFARQEDPSAESEEAKQAVRAAKDDPASWVMKPQARRARGATLRVRAGHLRRLPGRRHRGASKCGAGPPVAIQGQGHEPGGRLCWQRRGRCTAAGAGPTLLVAGGALHLMARFLMSGTFCRHAIGTSGKASTP
ncbi:unnamed protein product [Prorocentrum cordatum]|uniref:glutathione synthase n=1 Tax=Prorocentrum cordatum TaxID=2364126 RepID=A0ABN9ULY3_9DINO|nr:unnamed protein product [Polarella glacialis]